MHNVLSALTLALSLLTRLAALGWSAWLLRRHGGWRLGVMTAAIAAWVIQGIFELTRVGEAGQPPEVSVSGLLAGVCLLLAFAVTSPRRASSAEDRRFSTIFHSSPDAIILSSFPEGRIVDVNESFTTITGHAREQTLGRTSLDLDLWSVPEDRARLGDTLASHGRVRNMESEFRHRSGELHTCLISAEVVELEDARGVLTMLRDISERKLVERDREALIQELETKNAELERFTYTVSHDLKSPLVTIRGFLGLLERDAMAGNIERMRQDAERIRAATEVMRRLLDELLELSRVGRQVNPPQEVSLGELAHEAARLVTGTDAIDVRISQALPVVVGDRARLLEVFQNLIENAVKYMGDESSPRIEIAAEPDADGVVCSVKDNGIGIEPRYHDKVFGLFERLQSDQEGTGVGLALVKRIVEVHGGRIWVESSGSGSGSAFLFTLPRKILVRTQEPVSLDAPSA